MNSEPYGILYVDDEAKSLEYFEKAFSKAFKIFIVENAAEALKFLEERHQEIAVLMTDEKMPGQRGVELLEKVRDRFPEIIRILVTAYSDLQSTIDAVNNGAIYKYISKPWEPADLRITLMRALEYFVVLKERDQLLREKLSVLQQIVLADRAKNLGVFAAGLCSRFRHTLVAANQFMADVPQAVVDRSTTLAGRRTIFRSMDQSIREANAHIFRIAVNLEEISRQPVQNEIGTVEEVLCNLASDAAAAKLGSLQTQADLAVARAKVYGAAHAGIICERLAANMKIVASRFETASIQVRSTMLGSAPATEFSLDDGTGTWTTEQRSQFFAPFSGANPASAPLGLDLVACYFVAHHYEGRVMIPGNETVKAKLILPQAPLPAPAPSLQENQLEKLFRYETGWEEFFQRKS